MADGNWKRPTRDLAALAVLGLLSEQPRHPYQILRDLHQRRKEFATGTPRAVYHAVDRLAGAGLIEPVETMREGRRPERTVYRITESGREEFSHWLVDLLGQPERLSPIFASALSLIGYLPQREVVWALGQRVAGLEGMIAGQDAVLATLQERLALPRLFVIEREYEKALWRAELAWIGSLVAELESGALAVDQDWLQAYFCEPGAELSEPLATSPGPAGTGSRRRPTGRPELTVESGGGA